MSMILNYRKFLREKLEKEFFISQDKYLILGENFLENAYFVFVQNCMSVYNSSYYLFIVDKNKIAKFKIEVCKNHDGYIRIYKKTLFSIIGRKYYSIFAKHGLATTEEVALRLENYCCFHRLVLVLYVSMLNLHTHHINLRRNENCITNIIPINSILHDSMHKSDAFDNFEDIGNYLQEFFLKTLKKSQTKRKTIAQDDEIIEQVLRHNVKGDSVIEIQKALNNKISKRSIYNILEQFHSYRAEFLEWLERKVRTPIQELDAKSETRWCKILEFDRLLDQCA